MVFYAGAAICRRGHVVSFDVRMKAVGDIPRFCKKCGAEVVTHCPTCGEELRGRKWSGPPGSGAAFDILPPAATGGYTPPSFCHSCGAAFPWVGRKERIYELENLLAEEGLDEPTRARAEELLRQLARPEIEEDEERKLWQRLKGIVPGLFTKDSARTILQSLVSAEILRLLT